MTKGFPRLPSSSYQPCHKGIKMRKQGNILQKGSDDPGEDQVLLPLASGWAKSIYLYLYPTQRAGGIITTTDSSSNKRLTDHSTLCTLQTIIKWAARGWVGVINGSSLILSLIFPLGLSYCTISWMDEVINKKIVISSCRGYFPHLWLQKYKIEC